MEKNRNQRLDLYRCIAVYGIVFIHIMFPGNFGVSINCVARFGVALFFLSAGYFSFDKAAPALLRRMWHTVGLLILACIPPAGIDLLQFVRSGGSILGFIRGVVTLANIKQLLTIQVLPFVYAGPLWFLASLIVCYLVWWLLTLVFQGKRLPYPLLAAAAAAALAVHFWLGEGHFFRGLPSPYYLYLRNAWLFGLPFFALGAWMHSREDRLRAAARPWAVYGLLALGALLALWERWITDFFDLNLGIILMALSAMTASICWPELKHQNPLARLLVRGGTITFSVYVLHLPMMFVVDVIAGRLSFLSWLCLPWLRPLSVAAATTVLALVLLYLRRAGSVLFLNKKKNQKEF